MTPETEQQRLLSAFEAAGRDDSDPGRRERLLAELAQLEAQRATPDAS